MLATVAQSAAALVAIVGGLLVSRAVQLNSERENLVRTAEDLHREISHHQRTIAGAKRET
jgi:hypothetical protein